MRYKFLCCLAAFTLLCGCDSGKGSEGKIAQTKQSAQAELVTNQAPAIEIQKASNHNTKQKDNSDFFTYDIHGQKRVSFGLDDSNVSRSVGALAMVRSPLEVINLKLIKGQLSKEFILKCSACHNDYANGIIGPSLLTKSSDEIFNMISAYKNKEKANVLMKDLIKNMSDTEIRSLADEISNFNEQFRKGK
ncbi:hypothetical protein CCAL9344_00860 [Campylobacter sp. RM9344]|uniref:Cytochrome c domain-containing protein n=1 Tax=Campylobacter californiensis TaxID=1032243 RepID=A0AAW3ZUN7_9BACT|nr:MULTISPECIES: hypothetical protein [unclassified Campylobacter]MBE2983901.1 hypothetical protein [Campylobacter sp. RM6883]MBE2994439.1 hypothetical protein [Campylobacter sp. RM6913]MBE3028747.1 hypothetical protein [Campylobacter sp. RM9344]MBE3607636.1 hypothetical protein [Campylobacter sp. RM9337]QCD51028.1 monoheme c-type cytochrome [Campylobacter sp. RM6914]